jgi:glycosyltransferase involved in cell wall biosynthesis
MFGWEFPPHISGGLGTACYGMSMALLNSGVNLLFVVPASNGEEEIPVINASKIQVEEKENSGSLVDVTTIQGTSQEIKVSSTLRPYTAIHDWYAKGALADWSYTLEGGDNAAVRKVTKSYPFRGGYGPGLLQEVFRYGEVAATIAAEKTFDVIHAHDWLTYPAGIEAKRVSGRPLIIHVHATEYDRAGGDHVNDEVYDIEKKGMDAADRIVAVSHWTRDIIISRYGVDPEKVVVVHNGIAPRQMNHEYDDIPFRSEKVITFLGRITHQKGPRYFVEAASKVLKHFPDVHFVMAGSGDLLPAMMELSARLKMSSRFHFTGFLKGDRVDQLWNISNAYVMPSVSEPFGITPMEAAQAGVPIIISHQSGVSEVLAHAIKVDFWDTDALANAMIGILKHEALANALAANSRSEVEDISWQNTAFKLTDLYAQLLKKA